MVLLKKEDRKDSIYFFGYFQRGFLVLPFSIQSHYFFGPGDFSTCSPIYFLPSTKIFWAFKSKKLWQVVIFF